MKPIWLVVAAAVLGWIAWKRRSLGRIELGIWLALAVAAGLYGFGVFRLPNLEKIIEHIGTTLGAWTYLLVGALAFLETGAFIGLVAPGETAILLGGFVAGQGKVSLVLMLGLVWFAAFAGDTVSYLLGRRLGREFLVRHGPRVKITEDRLVRVEGFFARYGGATILIGRFIGLVRAIAPFIAGASKLPYRRFLPYDVLGTGIWGCGLVILGYVFWQSFDQLVNLAKKGLFALGATLAIVVGIVAAYRFLREEENRIQLREWIERQPLGERVIVPAIRLLIRWLPGRGALEVATLAAAGLVGGFTFGAFANLTQNGARLHVDTAAADVARSLMGATLVDVAKVVTYLGSQPVVEVLVLATVAWLVTRRRIPEAVALVTGGIATLLAVQIAKAAVDRPRPSGALVATDGASYPSGHSAYAIAWLAVALAVSRASPGLAKRLGLLTVALVVVVVVGATRVYLRAHYFSDVLGGWGLGAACFAVCGLVVVAVTGLRQNEEERPDARSDATVT